MKKLIVLFVWLSLGCVVANAQSMDVGKTQVNRVLVSMDVGKTQVNGVLVSISTKAEGRATVEGFSRLLTHSPDILTVQVVNDATRLFIAYDLHVESQANGSQFVVTIKPPPQHRLDVMSNWFKRSRVMAERYPNWEHYVKTALPEYPPPLVVRASDQLRLTLWQNEETGARIVDELKFELETVTPPQDFMLAHLRLHLTDFAFRINGVPRNGTIRFGKFSGPLPWVYVPGYGRFIFSLLPHEGYGFQKTAVLEDKTIRFTHDGKTHEWISDELILGQRGKWHLWMLHDAAFQGDAEDLKNYSLISPGNCCLYGALDGVAELPRVKQ